VVRVAQNGDNEGDAEPSEVIEPLIVQRQETPVLEQAADEFGRKGRPHGGIGEPSDESAAGRAGSRLSSAISALPALRRPMPDAVSVDAARLTGGAIRARRALPEHALAARPGDWPRPAGFVKLADRQR
jgi:hypothetical protein